MITNPPAAVHILREHMLLLRSGVGLDHAIRHMAVVIARLLGHLPYKDFLTYWHLHLQLMPFEVATAAWGLVAAGAVTPATFTVITSTSPAQ